MTLAFLAVKQEVTNFLRFYINSLKGDFNPGDKYVYKIELYEPWNLKPDSFESVEKYGSYRRWNIC